MFGAKVLELLRGEIGAVVGDDTVRNPKSIDNRLDEVDGRCSIRGCDRLCLNPFGEIVYCHY